MKRILRIFQRLQWKLALSYTVVTVGTLLVVGLLLSGVLIYTFTSDFYTRLVQRSMQNHLVEQVRPFLSQSPPDIDNLEIWTRSLVTRTTTWTGSGSLVDRAALSVGSLNIRLDENLRFLVLDSQRKILAQVAGSGAVELPGTRFHPSMVRGSEILIDRALGKGLRGGPLFARYEDGASVAVAPVVDGNGKPLGVILVGYGAPVSSLNLLARLLRPILFALVPAMLMTLIVGTAFGFLSSRGFVRRLQRMSSAAEAWSQGDFSQQVSDPSQDEIGQLSLQLNEMATQLQSLVTTQQELAATEERNRLARELHDTVKQKMFAIAMQLAAARAVSKSDPQSARSHISEAEELVRQSQRELTGLVKELRPLPGGRELARVLRDYVADWSRQTGIKAEVSIDEIDNLAPLESETLLRVAQEALANVARHSEAGSVELRIGRREGAVHMTVRDDGQGFEPPDVRHGRAGIGIESMRERLAQVSGELGIASGRGTGTRIVASIPILRKGQGR